jgi:hypothetical protein
MTNRARIGIVLLVLLSAGLLSRITNHAGVPPQNPDRVQEATRAEGILPTTETVDLTNGNLHLQIPILATHGKPTAPRSGH